jgi:hypothetical protein
MDNVLMKPLVFLVRHRQVSTIFLGLFICGVSFIAVYNFSKPTIHDKQYLGDMKTINIDYFTIIVPSSVILLEPKQFYLTFPEGDIIFSETSFGPNEAKRSEQSQIFAINNVSLPKPWLNGKIGNHSYQLFVKVEGRNLWIVLEMTCIDHLLIFRHFTKIPTDIIYTKDNVFSPKSGFERLIDPVATAKVFWFLSSVTKFMDYYKVEPRHGHIVRGDYRTVNGVILTHLHPPFDIKNSKVVLAYPGSSKVRIYAKGSFAPSRKSRNQLVESLISTLNALLHGSYQISYLADFSSVEVLGREEVSIQMPLTGDKDQIALNTFGTANFLDENLQTQNITLSLSALVNNKDELALQLGFWKLICQTLEYHHTIRPSNRDTFMEVPDYDALRVGMEISVRAASFSYFWQ